MLLAPRFFLDTLTLVMCCDQYHSCLIYLPGHYWYPFQAMWTWNPSQRNAVLFSKWIYHTDNEPSDRFASHCSIVASIFWQCWLKTYLNILMQHHFDSCKSLLKLKLCDRHFNGTNAPSRNPIFQTIYHSTNS